jgi:hypothetical protein
MDGANAGLDIVPLESAPGTLSMLARFPAGFARLAPGGYAATEEFLVIDGALDFEGVRHARGSLVHVPAAFLRTSLVSPDGRTVLAWWGGPAEFLSVDRLRDPVQEGLIALEVASAGPGTILSAGLVTWTRHESGAPPPAVGDAVDLALTRWHRTTARPPDPGEPFFLRALDGAAPAPTPV